MSAEVEELLPPRGRRQSAGWSGKAARQPQAARRRAAQPRRSHRGGQGGVRGSRRGGEPRGNRAARWRRDRHALPPLSDPRRGRRGRLSPRGPAAGRGRAAPRSTLPPAEALRAWMGVFIDYIAAKKVIAPALKSLVGGGSALYADFGRADQSGDGAARGARAGERRHPPRRRSRRSPARADRLRLSSIRRRTGRRARGGSSTS